MNINVNGIDLHFLDEGEGAPVLMLHGFPDSSRAWRHQIPALTAAGFRCIVPDLRGFGETEAPTDVSAYAIPEIERDLIGLLDHLGLDRVELVAHDWGAALGWYFTGLNPERVERYVTLQVGHGPTTSRDARNRASAPGTSYSSCSRGPPKKRCSVTTGGCSANGWTRIPTPSRRSLTSHGRDA